MMNKIFRSKVVLLLITSLFLMQNLALADVYAAKAGVKTATAYDSDQATALTSGYYIQYIWLKPGGTTKIYGPTDVNGNVNSTYEEDRPEVFPGLTNCNKMGYDTASGTETSLGAGHFYHQVTIEASGQQRFVCRVWNAATISSATYFGETTVYASNTSALQPPSENDLASMSTIFPHNTVPPVATPASGETTRIGQGSTPPQITVWCSSKIGARYYEFELYSDSSYTTQVGSTVTQYNDTSYHYASTSNGSQDRSTVFTLGTTDDDQTFYWRARAVNSFNTDPSNWATGNVYVPENIDPTIPMAVTDLTATTEGANIILSWTAPYDEDKYGVQAACNSYDIRVSTEAILNEPVDPFTQESTNPNLKTTWATAQSIDTYFAGVTIPSPSSWQTLDNVTISNAAGTAYFFAVKADDGSNWSYVSNIAGTGGTGAGGGGPLSYAYYTFTTSESQGLGINQFSIPYSGTITFEAGTGYETIIADMEDLVDAINTKAGTDIVKTVGWWDKDAQLMVGWTDVDGTPTAQNGAPTNLSDLNLTNKKDYVFQMSVAQPISFNLQGSR